MRRLLPIIVDVHEPESIKLGLAKTLDVFIKANEPQGLADMYWNNGTLIMRERKKPLELLREIGNILDVQIIKYNTNHPDAEIGIIQEGLITPGVNGMCMTWKKTQPKNRNSPIMVPVKWPKQMRGRSYAAYQAWVYQRGLEGISLYVTLDEQDTVEVLSAQVYNSMKQEHKGLARSVVIKDKKEQPYKNHLRSIGGIGEKTADKLLESWGTPWDLYSLPYEVLVEMEGERVASSVFKGIGRAI